MGFTRTVDLYCDGDNPNCEAEGVESSNGDSRYETIAAYKRDMKMCGWVFRQDNKAYCPVCAKDLKGK